MLFYVKGSRRPHRCWTETWRDRDNIEKSVPVKRDNTCKSRQVEGSLICYSWDSKEILNRGSAGRGQEIRKLMGESFNHAACDHHATMALTGSPSSILSLCSVSWGSDCWRVSIPSTPYVSAMFYSSVDPNGLCLFVYLLTVLPFPLECKLHRMVSLLFNSSA